MFRLMKYDIIKKLKNFNIIFWPLFFPLILGTLFYFGFGTMDATDFETVPVAIVATDSEAQDEVFIKFLDSMAKDEDGTAMIQPFEMTEAEALTALTEAEVSGIYYTGNTPSLTISRTGMNESILQILLENYENSKQTMHNIYAKHSEGLEAAIAQMQNYDSLVEQISLGGKTLNNNITFFYALIAMACLYGSFIGFGSSLWMQANLSPLAARRCVTPTHKLKLIVSEMLSSFLLHFLNLTILLLYLKYIFKLDFGGDMGQMLLVMLLGDLIGVSLGMFIGSIGKMSEGTKVALILGVSMTCSFLSGLMEGNMKYYVEQHAPIINRINPAALISDAFYCINVYDNPARFSRNLITLLILSILLVGASFLIVRRERYDSI